MSVSGRSGYSPLWRAFPLMVPLGSPAMSGLAPIFGEKRTSAGRDNLILLLRKCGLRRNPKSDGQPVVDVHQADRDRQVGKFLVGEHGRSGLEVGVRHGGVGDASDGFGPGKSGAFACVE